MLNAVIRFSLHYRSLIVMLSVAVMVYGSYLAAQLPIDVFPDLDRPRVVLLTECPGLATEEVETLVTQPLEIALLGAGGVQAVRSQTTAGLSVVYIEFDWNVDVRAARQTVQERLGTLTGVLPDGIVPQMTPTASIMGQIVIAGMYRQRGPNGGELVPVGSDLVAEILEGAAKPQAVVAVWRVKDRHRPATWQREKVENIEWQPARDDSAQEVKVTIDGTAHTLTIPTELEQQMALRALADWVVRPRLRKIAGIAEVFVQGGDRKQYQVLLDPAALLDYNVSLGQVEEALRNSNLNTSGGFAIEGETERPIRILGRIGPESDQVLADLLNVPIAQNQQRPVLLRQVARVVEGPQVKRGDGAVNGTPGVVITVAKQPHVDTRALTEEISTVLAEVESSLPADIVINSELFRLKNFIDRGIFNVAEALVIGAVLVVIVLYLFLLNFRTTFITLTAIPLSLVITTLVFRLIGWLSGTQLSINVMTLGGIAVAMGELVDDAIVDVENIFRRLKENNAKPQPLPAITVVYEASKEIRSAIVFGTAVVILVFLPLFALGGVEGRLFAPLGVAYIVAILASLLVSLTVTPVLSFYLLPPLFQRTHHAPRDETPQEDGNDKTAPLHAEREGYSEALHAEREESTTHDDSFVLRHLKTAATPLVRLSMAHAGKLLLLTWLLVGLAGYTLTRLGSDFLPPFDEGSVQVNVSLPPGSSLEASNRAAALVDAKFQARQLTTTNPTGEIVNFVRRTGRAEMDEHAMPVSGSEYILSINPAVHQNRDELLETLLAELRAEVPGVDIEVEQPLAHLISHMVSGVFAQIAVKINGDDLDTLLTLADKTKAAMQSVPGVTPPVIEPVQQTDELHIRLKGDELARYNLTRAYVGQMLQTALQGEVVSQVLEGARRFDLLVRLEDAHRTAYSDLGRLRIDLPGGQGQVELGKIADIGPGLGPNAMNRENARRRIVIRCNTQGRDLASAVADIQTAVRQQIKLPAGYFIEYGGQFESQQRATRLIVVLAGVSVVGMFAVLMILFPSPRIVLQILNALPTAFIGGVLALAISGQSLTVASLVGFISLGGIAVRNGILLVTHYLHLMREEGEPFSAAMIMRGSLERLAPVLMTALTAGIGLVPLVIGGQEPGREILYPVATVILGGLVTSTFCEFVIHPGLFWRFSGKDAQRLDETDHV